MTDPHRQEPSADGKDTERVPAAEAPTGTESDESPVATASAAGAEHAEAPTAEPTDSTPAEPSSTDSTPAEPSSTDSTPAEPSSTDSTPAEPAPTDPAPAEPAPTDPAPTDPTPTGPAPTDPTPTDPTSAESSPTGSTATEQAPGHEAGEEAPGASVPPSGDPSAAKTRKPGRAALVTGIVIGVVGVVVAVLAVTAYAWPGFLTGPGKPDDVGAKAITAFQNKDAATLNDLGCKDPDGKPIAEVPQQLLDALQATKPTGAPTLLLDTQAQVPATMTLSQQGQTQDVPVAVVLYVNKGEWCVAGLSEPR
jgi:hypothetical protein